MIDELQIVYWVLAIDFKDFVFSIWLNLIFLNRLYIQV